jgi:hypothetical protein
MARGWESKSVEAQIDAAESRASAKIRKPIAAKELETLRRRESLVLSRTRIVREMESARNPRYRDLLKKSLAGLDAQIAAMH